MIFQESAAEGEDFNDIFGTHVIFHESKAKVEDLNVIFGKAEISERSRAEAWISMTSFEDNDFQEKCCRSCGFL